MKPELPRRCVRHVVFSAFQFEQVELQCCRFRGYQSGLLSRAYICLRLQWSGSRCQFFPEHVQQPLRYAFLAHRFRWLSPYHPVFQLLQLTPTLFAPVRVSALQHNTNLPMDQPNGRFLFPAVDTTACCVQYEPRNQLAMQSLHQVHWYVNFGYVPVLLPLPRWLCGQRC